MQMKIRSMQGGIQFKNGDYEEAIEENYTASDKAILPYAIYYLMEVTIPNIDRAVLH